jgi:thiol-disulfide isomerase/thioredoxin
VLLAAFFLVAGTAGAAAKPRIAGQDPFTGKDVSLSQFAGKPVFVSFWGSWFGGSHTEARLLARFATAHRAQVAFIGVDTLDSKTGARAFYREFDPPYPSIFDPRGLIGAAWTRGAPTTLAFDRKHRLVKRIEGAATLAELNAALQLATRR